MKKVIELAKEYVLRYPDLPNLTIAKMLYKNNPLVMTSVDSARSAVRTCRDVMGTQKYAKQHIVQKRSFEEIQNSLGIRSVKPIESEFKIFTLPQSLKWLILPDCHIPFHDKESIALACEYGKKENCNGIILNGDFADCYALSSFIKDPTMRRFSQEIDLVQDMLLEIKELIKPEVFLWKLGNHENRLKKFLIMKAPELFGCTFTDWSNVYNLDKYGVKVIEHGNPIVYHALSILHGDEIRGSSPVNPARGMFLKTYSCIYSSHLHRASTHTETNPITKETTTCWSSGCLCDTRPSYDPYNKWSLGFGILETKGKYWQVKNKSIIKGKVFEG